MAHDRFFCSVESRANGESIFGTVALARTWLLLEYPSVWRRRAIEDSWLLPAAVKSRIQKLQRQGVIGRSLLMRQDHHRSGDLRCFLANSSASDPSLKKMLLRDYDDLLRGMPEEPVDDLLFAVCTHGRHDKCCAKFGLPVACAFREHAGERAWECSHVGGDRYAGNVVVFPYGIYYGRVVPEDVPEIVRRSERSEVWLPRYRGRSCFPRAIQIAEYFARSESGRLGIDDFRPVETVRIDAVRTRVRLQERNAGRVHIVEYETRNGPLSQRLTCSSADASDIAQHSLRRYEVTAS